MLSLPLGICAILAALITSVSASASVINILEQNVDIGEDAKLDDVHASGTRRAQTTRIVGGNQAAKGRYPYFVLCDGCGASLIHADILLTAAHCNVNGISADVLVSAYQRGMAIDGAQARSVVERVPHPNYNSQTQVNDFMIMRLNEPVTGVTPIALNTDEHIPAAGDLLTAIGFGRLASGGARPNFLQEVDVPYVPYSKCNKQYAGRVDQASTVCAGFDAGGKDTCNGDSGGPLLRRVNGIDTQVGVVSWGEGCALPKKPTVYSRVSSQIDWIQAEVCRLTKTNPKPEYCSGPPSDAPIPTTEPPALTTSPAPSESFGPSVTPSDTPAPSDTPSDTPTLKPTAAPTSKPTGAPTSKPTPAPVPGLSERNCVKKGKKTKCSSIALTLSSTPLSPTAAPIPPDSFRNDCVDEAEATFVIKGKKKNCEWLAMRPNVHVQFCGQGSDPNKYCQKTCDSCALSGGEKIKHDTGCKDSTNEFWINDRLGHKTCAWLATQKAWQYKVCDWANEINFQCQRTCNSCKYWDVNA